MTPDDRLDAAVRRHLDAAAADVDGAAMARRVKPRASPFRRAAVAITGTAALAASIAAVLLFNPAPPKTVAAATAEQLVREAKEAHTLPADRGYDVTVEWHGDTMKRFQLPPIVKKSRVTTRGDQFWLESRTDDQTWAWGQEPGGRVWVALSRKRGLVFEPSEIGEPIARYADLMSLRVVSTLADVLERFEMYRLDAGTPGEPIRIDAKLRPTKWNPAPRFSRLELTLDPATKLIRKAVLHRQVAGEAVATLTFDLADTAPQPDAAYTLEGHLDPKADVFDRKGPGRAKFRDEFLKRMQQRLR